MSDFELIPKNDNAGDIVFSCPDEVLTLTSSGFIYKGREIQDAGEAHKIFLQVFYRMKKTQDDEL